METKSQNTQTTLYEKVCATCRRRLHISLYGGLWNSKDKFNPTCKQCRNFTRRRDFAKNYVRKDPAKKKGALGLVYPLDLHNQKVLSKAVMEKKTVDLTGNSTLDGKGLNVCIQLNPRKPAFRGSYIHVAFPNHPTRDRFEFEGSSISRDFFIERLVKMLNEQHIRLKDPEQSETEHRFFLQDIIPLE